MGTYFVPSEIQRIFFGREALREAGYLGVLGPRGCGKTGILDGLGEMLAARGSRDSADLVISVPLRELVPSGEGPMFGQLINRCRASLPPEVQSRVHQIGTSAEVDSFDRMVEELLDAVDSRIFFLFDDMDGVPEFFARAISRRFRRYWDQRGPDLRRQRVGFVFSGAFSGFKLTEDVESAITGGTSQALPFVSDVARQGLVQAFLEARGWEAGPEAIELLATETGGEPAFLDPVLRGLTPHAAERQIEPQEVQQLTGNLDWLTDQVGILGEILLSFCCDSELRRVVHQLDQGRTDVRTRSQLDIDPLQLAGAVVVDKEARPNVYSFRNGIVQRFFNAVIQGVAGIEVPRETRSDWAAVTSSGFKPSRATQPVLQLEALRKRALEQRRIRGCLEIVEEAWDELCQCGDAEFNVVICGEEGPRIAIAQAGEGVRLLPPKSRQAICKVVDEARRRGKVRVAVNPEQAIVAVKIGQARPPVFLVATAASGALSGGFGESRLFHWIRWVRELGDRISWLANNEVVVALVNDRLQAAEGGGEPPPPGDDALRARIRRSKARIRDEAKSELRFWKVGSLSVAVVLLGFLFWKYAPVLVGVLRQRWQELEPLILVIQLFGSALLVLLALFGFRSDTLEKRVWSRLGDWIYQRRLKSSHLLEIEGGGEPEGSEGAAPEPEP